MLAKMAQVGVSGQKGLSQTKEALLKSYQKRLKDDIKSMVENYVEIIKLGKVCCTLFEVWSVRCVGSGKRRMCDL